MIEPLQFEAALFASLYQHKNRLYPINKSVKIRRILQKVLAIKRDISIPTAIQNSVYPATLFMNILPLLIYYHSMLVSQI